MSSHGVDWIPRADGRGNEIRGVTQAQMDAYSTRTVQVHEKERELARAWERKHGRAPTSRELLHIANHATLLSRKRTDAGQWTGTRWRSGGTPRCQALVSSLADQRNHVLGILEDLSEQDLRLPILPLAVDLRRAGTPSDDFLISSGRPSSKPLTLPPLAAAVSTTSCSCGAAAVTSPLSLGDWKLASAWPMSYWPLTGPNPQNNISR